MATAAAGAPTGRGSDPTTLSSGARVQTAKVFSPVVDKRHIYGVDGLEEITVDFVEGNHPHYLAGGDYDKPDILLGE